MHHTLTADLAVRYGSWITWEQGTHTPPDHDDVPHLGGGTGDGWYGLQERLFRFWATRQEPWVLIQVKEKFAELTVYARPRVAGATTDGRVFSYVGIASRRVCEHCGAPGRVAHGGGWYSTVCERHRSFAIQDLDAAAITACTSADQVVTVLAELRARGPEPDAIPDVAWHDRHPPTNHLGERLQYLDAAITWLLELDVPLIERPVLDAYLPSLIGDSLDLDWPPEGVPRMQVVACLHAELQRGQAQFVAEQGRCWYSLVHLPDLFILPR